MKMVSCYWSLKKIYIILLINNNLKNMSNSMFNCVKIEFISTYVWITWLKLPKNFQILIITFNKISIYYHIQNRVYFKNDYIII